MKVKFTTSIAGELIYQKDQIIDGAKVPQDQLSRWLNRGVVVPVSDNPVTTATIEPKPVQENLKVKGKKVNG